MSKKIENLIQQLGSLEFMVSPAAWKTIQRAINALRLMSASIIEMEKTDGSGGSCLTLADLISIRDEEGRLRVDPVIMGGLFCDLAEAMRDIAEPEVFGFGFQLQEAI